MRVPHALPPLPWQDLRGGGAASRRGRGRPPDALSHPHRRASPAAGRAQGGLEERGWMSRRLVIRGGLVVTPEGVQRTEVVVAGERVAGLGLREGGGEVIDAEGCYVLPGGIDPHTHLLADVASATRSAAFGGTTTAVCFTNPTSGEPAAEAVVRGRDE